MRQTLTCVLSVGNLADVCAIHLLQAEIEAHEVEARKQKDEVSGMLQADIEAHEVESRTHKAEGVGFVSSSPLASAFESVGAWAGAV
jgi:hypothetical protein